MRTGSVLEDGVSSRIIIFIFSSVALEVLCEGCDSKDAGNIRLMGVALEAKLRGDHAEGRNILFGVVKTCIYSLK